MEASSPPVCSFVAVQELMYEAADDFESASLTPIVLLISPLSMVVSHGPTMTMTTRAPARMATQLRVRAKQ